MGKVWREIWASPGHMLVALLAAGCGIAGLALAEWGVAFRGVVCVGAVGAVVTDGYVVRAVWLVARAGAGARADAEARLPARTTAIALVFCFTAALATSFAALDLASGGISSTTASTGAPLAGWTDALYFSFVTLTTLGYGDFVPHSTLAKWLVMCELGSGILLLVGAVPLVIARITAWKS
jgi:hypothetical protein